MLAAARMRGKNRQGFLQFFSSWRKGWWSSLARKALQDHRKSEKSHFLHSLPHGCFTCINFLTILFPEHEESSEKTVSARSFQHVLLQIFLLPKKLLFEINNKEKGFHHLKLHIKYERRNKCNSGKHKFLVWWLVILLTKMTAPTKEKIQYRGK